MVFDYGTVMAAVDDIRVLYRWGTNAFTRTRRFVRENISTIIFGVVAAPVFYRLTRFTARHYLLYRRRRRNELIQKYKKQHMFELMEEGFEKTFKTYFDIMKQTIKENLSAEKYHDRLKNGGNKMENWMSLKIIAFSSIMSYVYASSMMTVLLRIQVNVISGLLFKQLEDTSANLDLMDGGAGDASAEYLNRKMTDEVQHKYMILTRYFCTDGVATLCKLFREKAWRIVERVSLKQKVTVADVEQLFLAIKNREIRNDPYFNDWCPISQTWNYMFSEEVKRQYLFPTQSSHVAFTDQKEAFLRNLIGEAYDLINLNDTKNILKFLEAQGFNYYLDRLTEFMEAMPEGSEESKKGFEDLTGLKHAPLAKLIPVMNSFIDVDYSEDMWAALLLKNDTLKSFSANVYESYSSKKQIIHRPPINMMGPYEVGNESD